MQPQRVTVPVTVDPSGDAEVYTAHLSGRLASVRYVKDDFADGVDFAITVEDTGDTIWTQSDVNDSAAVAPRQATHSTAGVASTYAADMGVLDYIVLAADRIKIVVDAGGNGTSGTFVFIVF